MVLGLEFGATNITYVAFGNNILEIMKDPSRGDEIFMLTKGVIPINGDINKAIDSLMTDLVTCNVTHVGFSKSIGKYQVNQIKNIEKLRNFLYSDYSTIIDLGSKNTKIHTFSNNKLTKTFTNGKCAAGSGSFIETMADRLDFSLQKFIKVALNTEEYVSLSGRCAVFCESDIVHLFQKGITKDKIAHGITRNVALNVKAILGSTKLGEKTLFVGGVSKNEAVLRDLKTIFPETNFEVGKFPFNAFASIFTPIEMEKKDLKNLLKEHFLNQIEIECDEPLKLRNQEEPKEEKPEEKVAEEKVSEEKPIEKSEEKTEEKPEEEEKKSPYYGKHYNCVSLGVDIGSVSTKGSVIGKSETGVEVLASFYRKTFANPIEAVVDVITKLKDELEKNKITFDKCFCGTTGSGRYLTGDFLGADLIKNEITAQVAGTVCFYPDCDTIFEIGGQDSKYISLSKGEIVDFEMNRVCAAGTGAFLEKQAKILGVTIDKFGDLALKNTKPPVLDSNCTVFTEMSLKDLLGATEKSDLAAGVCIASVRNFINKNVDGRKIGNKVVFSGAVAFNKGMVAAFEKLTEKEIFVSEYPHINGAIGIAFLTLEEFQANKDYEAKFKGFTEVIKQKYTLSTMRCKGCDNFCDVSVFEIKEAPKVAVKDKVNVATVSQGEAKKFYYNDRCEKYSGKVQTTYQVNLFNKYKELMEENIDRVPELTVLDKTIGYPRGMYFNEFYPLFGAFFKACGFKVVLSDETNKTIAETGSLLAGTQPCFPFKVAFGHFDNIMKKRCDYIFLPRILNGMVSNHKNTHYCPFMLAGPDIIVQRNELKGLQNNLDRPIEDTDKIISPTFYMARGEKYIKENLIKLGEALGVKPQLLKKAANIAYDAFLDFKDDIFNTGKNILELYKDYIYVVVGHPYVLYDNFLNMNIGDKLSKMGYMPLPADFLGVTYRSSWHIYQKEIEKKLNAAGYLKYHPNIKSVVLSYYACGMDAFSNKFYKEEINHPCYIMNMDEHTSDAGIQTRLEAFSDVKEKPVKKKKTSVKIADFNKVKGKTLWLPATNYSSEILAKAFDLFGINARSLDEAPDETFGEARKLVSEDVCLPCLATLEDMLFRMKQEDFNPNKEAFFQAGSNGPCRLGMYPQRQKIALNNYKVVENGVEKDFSKVPITIIDNNYFKSGLDMNFALLTWNSLFVHDMLQKLLLHARPYELLKGGANEVYDKLAYRLVNNMKGALRQIKKQNIAKFDTVPIFNEFLQEACEEFEEICDHSIEKPIIGITGEFYLKLNDRSNKYLIEYLEEKGFEVALSTLTEYFHYSNFITGEIVKDQLKDEKKMFNSWELKGELAIREKAQKIIDSQEAKYNEILAPYVPILEISSKELVKAGSKLVHPGVTGEPVCALGKASDFFYRNVVGVINIAPFNCMPGGVISMFEEAFRKTHENLPFMCLFYDGFENNYERIDNFVSNLK